MPIQEVGTHDTSQLKLIANALVSSRKIIVVTGAGISTNCGIPVSRVFPPSPPTRKIERALLISSQGLSLRERSL